MSRTLSDVRPDSASRVSVVLYRADRERLAALRRAAEECVQGERPVTTSELVRAAIKVAYDKEVECGQKS